MKKRRIKKSKYIKLIPIGVLVLFGTLLFCFLQTHTYCKNKRFDRAFAYIILMKTCQTNECYEKLEMNLEKEKQLDWCSTLQF